MTSRENILRAVRFETPEHIPMAFHINGACWHHYPQEALQELMATHPLLFPGFKPSSDRVELKYGGVAKAGEEYTDDWGCVWETTDDGIMGTVIRHPLADWANFEGYRPPDPATRSGVGPQDWTAIEANVRAGRAAGNLVCGGLRHGHTFLLLSDIRGYQNVLCDMVDDDPRFRRLLQMVEDFNMGIVQRWLKLRAEWMGYPEDLGMQVGPMISPALLRQFIKPSYQRLMKPARDAGCIVHMHSDGDIRDLVDDLIDGGVEVINLQDLVNGIDWIRSRFAGKVCIDLDIDRQSVTRFGTPAQIDALIREEVTKLGSKRGGLMMIYGMYPGVPLENAKALMDAMEKYAVHF